MIRDLGQELVELATNRQDIMEIIKTYGHGKCHLMAEALAAEFNLKVAVVKDKDSGKAVHSAVLLDGDLTFDAYGINHLETTFERYKEYVWSECGGEPVIVKTSRRILPLFYSGSYSDDEYEQALTAAGRIAEYIKARLNDFAASVHGYELSA